MGTAGGLTVHILLTAFCEHAQLRPDGRLDLRGVFHDLAAPGFPARQDEMVLVAALEWDAADAGRYAIRADLVGEDGRPSLTVNGEAEVRPRSADGRPGRTYLIVPLQDVVFPAAGAYRLELRIKGRTHPGPLLRVWQASEGGASERSPR